MPDNEIKKIERGSKEWHQEAYSLALSYVNIQQCKKCTYPVVHGYCCGYCGDRNPSETREQELAWEKKYSKK